MATYPEFNDSLDDFLGGPTVPASAPRQLPAQYAAIRETVPEFVERCPKCGGSGKFRGYTGRVLGNCFACKGAGSKTFKTSGEQRARGRASAGARKERVMQGNLETFKSNFAAEYEWLLKTAPRWSAAADILVKITKYGDVSDNTMAMIRRGIARDAEWAAKRTQVSPPVEIDASLVAAAFQKAREAGLKRIALRFEGVRFEADKRSDTIWVSASGYGTAKYGKIVDGKFIPFRVCTPEIQAKIVVIAADPKAAAQAYGFETNSCCVCGAELNNKESVETGIGPICAGRMGWTPGGKRVSVGDF